MRRRSLQCLDVFLGEKPVWVFQLSSNFHRNDDTRLFLATDIQSLADIWGPVWKSTRDSAPTEIHEYNVGNGVIVPWHQTSTGYQLPAKTVTEVFCHWIPSIDCNTKCIEDGQTGVLRKFFRDTDRLLIGADVGNGLRLIDDCQASMDLVKDGLRRKGALRVPRTSKSRRYQDAHAVQIQGSAMGFVSIADTVTYKRRKGHSMKDTLVERWRFGPRNPVDLEAYSGVEVSLCTKNARRRRLLHLLDSQTMRNYLKDISFSFISDDCEESYFRALQSPKTFRQLWKRRSDWRLSIGDAVSRCLDALQETGIDGEYHELTALWVDALHEGSIYDSDGDKLSCLEDPAPESSESSIRPNCDFIPTEEWIVTLFRSEHTWTGFLKDSPECLTMAVMSTACLDFDDVQGFGRRCLAPSPQKDGSTLMWKPGYPVLQTAILLNEDTLKDEGLTCAKPRPGHKRLYWDTTKLKNGSRFMLGDQGRLTVISAPMCDCPLIAEWEPVKSVKFQELKNVTINEIALGKNEERHHQEYIRGTWRTSPLDVLLLSKSTKTRFCEAR